MKLAVLFTALVSFAGLAAAEPGPRPDRSSARPRPEAAPLRTAEGPPTGGPADPYGAPNPARAERRAERREIMLQRFDVNHDGRLEPRERRIAKRELRHERKLRKLIRKYDLNH
ncbi:MAG TPA: hypothetical protein VFQ65_33000, partial [Kofleriaceae bacterium]|nr:hypothetical protein [Kofleriaceae bacterium]